MNYTKATLRAHLPAIENGPQPAGLFPTVTERQLDKQRPHYDARTRGPLPVVWEDGVVITDLSFKVLAIDPGAISILTSLNQPAGGAEPLSSLPRTLIDILRNRGLHAARGTGIVLHGEKQSFGCRVHFVEGRNGALREPMITIHFEAIASPREAIRSIASEFNLTDREEQVLAGISAGMSNKEIAEQLDISHNTVKAFLRLIMVKMGVNTRSGMVVKLMNSATDRYPQPSSALIPFGKRLGATF